MSDHDDDLAERLRRLGLRVGRDALAAFLAHMHKSRLGPTEVLEQLADLEERARAAVNLARRTRFACIGAFKPMDRFDWNHPEKIDRALVDRLGELDFVDRGENVLLKGGSGLGKTLGGHVKAGQSSTGQIRPVTPGRGVVPRRASVMQVGL